MDRQELKIIEGLRRVQEKIQVPVMATVMNVNTTERTVDVQDINGVTIYDVNLQAVSEGAYGFLSLPSTGSQVVVAQTEEGIWYVSSFSNADNFSLKTSKEDLKQWLTDLISTIEKITVTTAVGPSGTPINMPDFETIKLRLNNLLI
ncbi:MAG: hypothetical protein EPN37_04540 [Chitinophagaceae bacterium]|nr:MAG: hypothetical protein EPN37_04540 [Chitinophagaceae bacterium]